MKQDRIAVRWASLKDEARLRWQKLTDEDLEQISGREALVGTLRSRYGITREEGEQEVSDFESSLEQEREEAREDDEERDSSFRPEYVFDPEEDDPR